MLFQFQFIINFNLIRLIENQIFILSNHTYSFTANFFVGFEKTFTYKCNLKTNRYLEIIDDLGSKLLNETNSAEKRLKKKFQFFSTLTSLIQ
jgi:hypothetical protein